MAGSSTPAMAAAAASAGALGSLGLAFTAPEKIAGEAAAARGATNGALNLNFFCHRPAEIDPEKIAAAKAPCSVLTGSGELLRRGRLGLASGRHPLPSSELLTPPILVVRHRPHVPPRHPTG